MTIALGIAGAFIGGWIGSMLGWGRVTSDDFSPRSIALATLGAMVLLIVGRLAFRGTRGE